MSAAYLFLEELHPIKPVFILSIDSSEHVYPCCSSSSRNVPTRVVYDYSEVNVHSLLVESIELRVRRKVSYRKRSCLGVGRSC